MLTAAHVSFAYHRGALAIDDVSMSVARGSIVGLIGPNGSGKTTLVRLLNGTLSPSEGSVSLDGVRLSTFSRRDLARRIAVVPQETHVTFDFTVLEIVLMGRYAHLGTFALEGPEDMAVAQRALASTGTESLRWRSGRWRRPAPSRSPRDNLPRSAAAKSSASWLPARSRSRRTSCYSTSRRPPSTSGFSSRLRHCSRGSTASTGRR
jgi:ABC-type oligopeptide transport system ATPase subunit